MSGGASSPAPLQLVGFWSDPSGLFDYPLAWPHPAQLPKARWSSEQKERVVAYLRAGAELVAYAGMSMCRFEQECGARPCGTRDLTDGTWLWPDGLEHYVEVHGIALPERLVERAEHSSIPTDLTVDPFAPRTDRAWVEWCVANTDPLAAEAAPATERALRELVDRLKTAAFEVEVTRAGERWRLAFGGAGSGPVDYAPRLSIEAFECYLMRRRRPDPGRVLSAAQARQLAAEVLGRQPLMERAAAFLRGGGIRRLDIQPSAANEPGSCRWYVRSGTVSGDCPAEDELGLRYVLESMLAEGCSYHHAVQQRHTRLLGPTLRRGARPAG